MAKHLIIGGTGTLGTALVEKLVAAGTDVAVFSRDELKQSEMRKRFPEVRFILGDIRDPRSINGSMRGVDTVFHVAALKHVEFGEENPVEFIRTNLIGTINVAEAALAAGVGHVVFSSTDKGVLPINVYGMTKGISEKYLLSLNSHQTKTKFSVFKWSNVLGSRGSVVHTFVKSLKDERGVRVTDPRMTRFFVHIDDVVNFMMDNYVDASTTEAMIPPMKAARVMDLAETIAKIHKIKKYDVSFIGIRPGEKIHEVMISTHDYCMRSDTYDQYTADELETLLRRVI